jgi:ubiquinone/menaquinone biosynthesis C-methylase UbiE
MALYDKIGVGYDATRRADPFILSRLLHHLAPIKGRRYLDIGCGTANYTAAIAAAEVQIAGIDFSRTMLARAREKNPSLALYNARAEALPFRNGSFSGATCTFVHHHMDDPVAAFREVHRVLLPRSRFVLFNTTVEQMHHYWIGEYFPGALAQAAVPFKRHEVRDALAAANFGISTTEPYVVTDDLRDWFLLCGKYRPDLYLDPTVRAGISMFATAHDQEEIKSGVERLREDIASGRISEVRRKYAWDGGDYMFTVAIRQKS